MDPEIPFIFYTMPCIRSAQSREKERSIMLKYIEVALYYLHQPRGSTVNSILKYLENHCDDEAIQDTTNIYPVLWGALAVGMNENRINISPSGHRYSLDQEVEAYISSRARELQEERKADKGRPKKPDNTKRVVLTPQKFSSTNNERQRTNAKGTRLRRS